MRRSFPLGLVVAALLIGGCGPSQGQSEDWKIVFQGDRNGEWATFAVSLDGGDVVRISGNTAPSFGPPVPSPDGKRLILPEPYGLLVMRTDGSDRRRLGKGDPWGASWSPDSRWIAFVGPNGGISVIDADGQHIRRVTDSDYDSDPSWSPDGKRLAFIRDNAVMLVDADGEHERELAADDAAQPHWSRDGRSLSFIDWKRGLLTVSVDDGRLLSRASRLKADYSFRGVAWSPDGRQVAYTDWGQPNSPHIAVMNTDGSGGRTLTPKGEIATDPVWSPDSRTIVYARTERVGVGTELWAVRLDDGSTRRVTALYPNGVNVLRAAWIRGPVTPTNGPEPEVLVQKDGGELQNPQPISHLAASGSLVAIVPPERTYSTAWTLTPPLVLWDPVRGRLDRLSLASCLAGTAVAIADQRVGFVCSGGHAASFGTAVEAFSLSTRRRAHYFAGAVGDGISDQALAGRVAGDEQFLYFTERNFGDHGRVLARRLWRVTADGKAVIKSGADAGEPAAVDGDNVAVERDDGVVTLLHADGSVVGRISPAGAAITPRSTFDSFPPATVDLDGPDLVVLRKGLLQLYDARLLELRRTWRVADHAWLGGLAGGIAAYAAGGDVHVLRLRDGAEAVIPAGEGHLAGADLTTAGLFYAVNTRPVRYDYVPITDDARSRIVFIQWDSLVRRLQ